MKNIGIAFVVIVFTLFGMNQYVSYKVNKAASDRIEAIEKVTKDLADKKKELEEEFQEVNSTVTQVRFMVASLRMRNDLAGNPDKMIELNGAEGIFSNILGEPVDSCDNSSETQCWENVGDEYTYRASFGSKYKFTFDGKRFLGVENWEESEN